MVECLECGNELELLDVEEGEIIICPECGSEMEIITLDPPMLEKAPEEEEDWGE